MAFIIEDITLDEIRASNPKTIFYGANTCWWTHNPQHLCKTSGQSSLPCDPRGGMLFQTDDVEGFLESILKNASHYGRHGVKAFMAAHHQNCRISENDHRSTCLVTWDDYNDALDSQGGNPATTKVREPLPPGQPSAGEIERLKEFMQRLKGKREKEQEMFASVELGINEYLAAFCGYEYAMMSGGIRSWDNRRTGDWIVPARFPFTRDMNYWHLVECAMAAHEDETLRSRYGEALREELGLIGGDLDGAVAYEISSGPLYVKVRAFLKVMDAFSQIFCDTESEAS